MSTNLHISKSFALPLDLVTSTQAILARRRSGKSYTASVEAEELLKQKQQIAVIDPTSAWYGLRSSEDGTGEGFPIIVFGGDHSDAPIDYMAGRAMAKAMVEHGFSAIFDIGNLHTNEQIQFVMEFCSELLRINRTAIHVFMDEADTFAPQKPLGLLQNKCLGTVSRLVKQGGIRGVGFTMITQRPQSVNKDVLSQVDMLTVLRMSHPLDIKAATDWIKSEVSVTFAKEVEAALPSLPVGTAFFCSAPMNIGQRVEVRKRHTFNSGATPKPGERKIEPKVLAKVDIEKLGQQISESVKRAKEESPEYLKQKIRELEDKISSGGVADMGLSEDIQRMEQELEELRPLRDRVVDAERLADEKKERYDAIVSALRRILDDIFDVDGNVQPVPSAPTNIPKPAYTPTAVATVFAPARHTAPPVTTGEATGLELRILRSLAEFAAIGRTEIPRPILSAWAEARGGYFNNTLGKMKTAGLIHYPSAGTIGLAEAGKAIAPKVERPPNRRAFFEACVTQAGTGLPERIMRELYTHYPNGLSRDRLSEAVKASGGYYNNTVGTLRTAGFIEYPSPGAVRLQPWTQMQ